TRWYTGTGSRARPSPWGKSRSSRRGCPGSAGWRPCGRRAKRSYSSNLIRIVRRIRDFIADSRAVGLVLLGCAALSLTLANTWGQGWLAVWRWGAVAVGGHDRLVGASRLPGTVTDWLNDA